jgi:hypothetical protein
MRYERGDVVQAGSKQFLISEDRGTFYAAFNMRGHGEAQYKLPASKIEKKLFFQPDHPWLQKIERNTVILVDERSGVEWHAEVDGHPEWKATGADAPVAIGNLVVLHGENIGIIIRPI